MAGNTGPFIKDTIMELVPFPLLPEDIGHFILEIALQRERDNIWTYVLLSKSISKQ